MNMVNLDITRILAALLVLSVHIGQRAGFDFSVGARGVQLFFVLSGYLAMASLERNSSAKLYYIKRVKKILPTYYVGLIIIWLRDFLVSLHRGIPLVDIIGVDGICGIKFLRYFFFLQVIIPTVDWKLWGNRSGTWTMSTFAVFYLLAPLLYKKINSYRKSLVLFVVLLFATPYAIQIIENQLSHFPAEACVDYFAGCHPIAGLYSFLGGGRYILQLKKIKRGNWQYGFCWL